MKVLDIERGIIDIPERFTPEEKIRIEAIKARRCFAVDGNEYAGYCLACNRPILKHNVSYLENKDGLGNIIVQSFHRRCNK